jgi:hypothetical protein
MQNQKSRAELKRTNDRSFDLVFGGGADCKRLLRVARSMQKENGTESQLMGPWRETGW